MNLLTIVNFRAVADAAYDFVADDVYNFVVNKAEIIEKRIVQWEKDNSNWDFGLSIVPIVGGVMQAVKEYTLLNEWSVDKSIKDTFDTLARKERCKTLGIIAGLTSCVASAFFFSLSGFVGGTLLIAGVATLVANLYTSLSNQKLARGLRVADLAPDQPFNVWHATHLDAEIL